MNEILGVLIYEDAQPMDIIGPWEIFAFWKNIIKASLDMFLVSENGAYVQCVNDIVLKAHVNFSHCPDLDYLLVPGGPGRHQQVNNDKLISFIQRQSRHCKYILSDCTGMFLLHQAGLLNNQSATTYWQALPELKSFPEVQTVEKRIVKSGQVWTAGGVSSGIDLALALIATIAGEEAAGKVQLLFEYFPNNKVYCTPDTVQQLPPYPGSTDKNAPPLPHYIRDYIDRFKTGPTD
ncbi:DJ-1/PfpI family protein [Aquicella lusitana]|uniref:DJ-1/PfpI family protein n=1 Tax=Aquicella lusitana TaxID=254246 RepID=A0A370GI78_9COXI|nr:DJ-1/PfpI family protein [Aquicella lusitana]RDI43351.1 DJ-1/PfpI family protein [Aquicella lusitana]VVC73501.1 Isonitrile hydratase [Aquicella lusitana]